MGRTGSLIARRVLAPPPTDRDSRGNDDGPGGRHERPQDRRGHEGQPVTQTTKQFMRQLRYSSPWAGHHVGPDAKIMGAHRGVADHEANVMRVNMTSSSSPLTICVWGSAYGHNRRVRIVPSGARRSAPDGSAQAQGGA